MSEFIRAELSVAPDQIRHIATALGMTAKGRAPVLKLCRMLIAAGHDPTTRMQVWRGGAIALSVRSIGEAAGLTVSEATSDGIPRFVRLRLGFDGAESVEGSLPMRRNESRAPDQAEAAE